MLAYLYPFFLLQFYVETKKLIVLVLFSIERVCGEIKTGLRGEVQRTNNSCGHTTDIYLGKPFLPRANSSKICLGKFISGFVLPR